MKLKMSISFFQQQNLIIFFSHSIYEISFGIMVPVSPSFPHLKVTEQVLESSGVGDDGGFVATVDCSHQGEGEVEDVAVK